MTDREMTDRLTLPHYGGKGHYMKCSEDIGCIGNCGDCEELDRIIERLAEYEDNAERKPLTNADRIRAMSDEDLAYRLMCPYEIEGCNSPDGNCNACVLDWLREPAEVE